MSDDDDGSEPQYTFRPPPANVRSTRPISGYNESGPFTRSDIEKRNPVVLELAQATVLQFALEFFTREDIIHSSTVNKRIRENLSRLGNDWWKMRLERDCPDAMRRYFLSASDREVGAYRRGRWQPPSDTFFFELYLKRCRDIKTLAADKSGTGFAAITKNREIMVVSEYVDRLTFPIPENWGRIAKIVYHAILFIILRDGRVVELTKNFTVEDGVMILNSGETEPRLKDRFLDKLVDVVDLVPKDSISRGNLIVLTKRGKLFYYHYRRNPDHSDISPLRISPLIESVKFEVIAEAKRDGDLCGLTDDGLFCFIRDAGFLKPREGRRVIDIVGDNHTVLALYEDGIIESSSHITYLTNADPHIPPANTWFVQVDGGACDVALLNTGQVIVFPRDYTRDRNRPTPVLDIPFGQKCVQVAAAYARHYVYAMTEDGKIHETVRDGDGIGHLIYRGLQDFPRDVVFALPNEL